MSLNLKERLEQCERIALFTFSTTRGIFSLKEWFALLKSELCSFLLSYHTSSCRSYKKSDASESLLSLFTKRAICSFKKCKRVIACFCQQQKNKQFARKTKERISNTAFCFIIRSYLNFKLPPQGIILGEIDSPGSLTQGNWLTWVSIRSCVVWLTGISDPRGIASPDYF